MARSPSRSATTPLPILFKIAIGNIRVNRARHVICQIVHPVIIKYVLAILHKWAVTTNQSVNVSNRTDVFRIPTSRSIGGNSPFLLKQKGENLDHRYNILQIVQLIDTAFIDGLVSAAIDSPQHKMGGVLFIGKGDVLGGFSLPKIPGECAQRETVDGFSIRSIRAFEVKGNLRLVWRNKTDVGIMVLVLAEHHSVTVSYGKPRDDRK